MKLNAGGPLTGLRVLEIGHFVAAPFCTRLLGDLGADVIKIEPPGGDPVRQWGAQVDGRSLWWSIHARNKRSVVMNLKARRAPEIILGLAAGCDVVVENFRPGGLERLGLGDDALRAARPDLILAHISGFGQDGPYRDRAAFGVIGEAMGGIRHLTDHPPGTWILIAANSEALDTIVAAWTRRLPAEEVTRRLSAADIPNTRVYAAADVQFRHRGMVREVDDPLLGRPLHPGIMPHVSEGPGVDLDALLSVTRDGALLPRRAHPRRVVTPVLPSV